MHSSTRGPTPAARQALLVFGLALLLRLVFCFAIYPQIVEQFGQGDGYDVIARNLASGHGYTLPDIDAPAERLPLYPFLLAASFKLFGPADWPWQILQALIGAATCSLVYRLARHYASRSAALAVATVCVFHPSLLLFTARPLTETVYVLLTVLFAWAVLQRRDGLAGVFAGLAMLVKSTAIVHLLVLLVFTLSRFSANRPSAVARRRSNLFFRLNRFVVVLAATGIVLAPWAVWNIARFGSPHLSSATSGRALYHGLYISRRVGWTVPTGDLNLDAEVALRQELATHGIAAEADVTLRDRVAGELARDWIATHWSETLQLWSRNLLLTWYLGRSRLSMLVYVLLHGPLLIVAALGAWRIWRKQRESRDLVFLSAALILAYTGIHAVIQPAVRYILPAIPLATLLSAGVFTTKPPGRDVPRPLPVAKRPSN